MFFSTITINTDSLREKPATCIRFSTQGCLTQQFHCNCQMSELIMQPQKSPKYPYGTM